MKYFEENDNDIYLLIKHPILLYFAKLILQDTVDQFCMVTLKIWSIKYFATFIKVVEDIKDDHLKIFLNIFDNGKNKDQLVNHLSHFRLFFNILHIFSRSCFFFVVTNLTYLFFN